MLKAKRDFDNIYNYYINQENNDINNEKSKQIICIKKLRDNELILVFDNLPIVINIYNINFTEYGNVYNTTKLNLINEDKEINSYRKTMNIFFIKFYNKLFGYYKEISNTNNAITILDNILIDIMRSIDDTKLMFLSHNYEYLNKMNILFMIIGINIIGIIMNTIGKTNKISLNPIEN